jgi:HNH endonuclease
MADVPENLEHLRSSIEAASRLLSEKTRRLDPPVGARQSIAWLRTWQFEERGLRLALVRVVRELHPALIHYLGHDNLSSLLTQELKLSGRTAQRLRSEAWLFEDNAQLRQAYETGQVGLGQAYLIDRVASRTTISDFISRASSVTHLYFEREIQFRERLQAYAPRLAQQFPGPLPSPGLEETLREHFSNFSSPDSTLGNLYSQLMNTGNSHSEDPAQDSQLLRRLESLLELVVLAEEEAKGTPSPSPAPTLAGHDSQTTISFWAPVSIIEVWERSLALIRQRNGPLPTWALVTLLVEAAMSEWCKVDTRSRSNYPIHEREEWRCQAPGCSARRHLEVHHIIFKARGGSDDPENLVTICHGHHRLIHDDEIISVTGKAPSDLLWNMGRSGYWRGNKRWQASIPGQNQES